MGRLVPVGMALLPTTRRDGLFTSRFWVERMRIFKRSRYAIDIVRGLHVSATKDTIMNCLVGIWPRELPQRLRNDTAASRFHLAPGPGTAALWETRGAARLVTTGQALADAWRMADRIPPPPLSRSARLSLPKRTGDPLDVDPEARIGCPQQPIGRPCS